MGGEEREKGGWAERGKEGREIIREGGDSKYNTPRMSRKWNGWWVGKPKPSPVPGWERNGRESQANPSIRSNSGRDSSWHWQK